ncbi:MDM12 [Candida jiufengensis]|uniref:MDM12 n=1 Tax=Candida jiufengensis TaxID=497108 RepID=UPI002224806E|nr:MDM12 [Candida jiufengensis]KAI5951639.1 MDM12 [Candida jiufengensis]
MVIEKKSKDNLRQNSNALAPSIQIQAASLNNSDDESSANKKNSDPDFVSFPTIADPETHNDTSISGLISKTFRKVTTNATNLVQNYSPKQNSFHADDEIKSTHNIDITKDLEEMNNDTIAQIKDIPKVDNTGDTKSITSTVKSVHNTGTKENKESKFPMRHQKLDSITSEIDIKSKQPSVDGDKIHLQQQRSKSNQDNSSIDSSAISVNKIRKTLSEDQPKVSSDHRSLRLSTLQFPRIQTPNPSTTSSVVNVNAQATVDSYDLNGDGFNQKINKKKNEPLRSKSLTSKISTIFNNLPNDIELSDDSASDSDNMQQTNTEASSQITKDDGEPFPSSTKNNSSMQLQYDLASLYGETISKPSPVQVSSKRKSIASLHLSESPTVTSFHAIQNKDLNASKKKSSNFSTLFLDNAKTIINQNIGAVTSSASSIVAAKKKKKKPKKVSANPLKNGGIPKKYWMNDAFVSDCLNCFKPFTAFRRKHHCRFCGQIFCSDCTMFISYTQHKDERNNVVVKKPYNDKLRVCKPCYSDVIIYLSDDSSGSDSDNENDKTIEEDDHSRIKNEDLLVPNHPLSRIRSMSTSSYKDSNNNSNAPPESVNSRPSEHGSISDSPSRDNSHFIYPDESIKTNPKQAPRMAIPTTRAGESVEIPLTRNSLSNGNLMRHPINKYSSSFKVDTLAQRSTPQTNHVVGAPVTPINHHFSNNAHTFGQNSRKSNTNSSSGKKPDILSNHSFENINSFYNSYVGRKPSFKLRSHSEKRHNINEQFAYRNEDEEADVEDSSESESENEEINRTRGRGRDQSDEEDERAMSVYSSLNDQNLYSSTPIGPNGSHLYNSSLTVPTLGEFPSIKTKFADSRGPTSQYSNIFNGSNVGFNDSARPETLRSRARANASLQRMRSRRQSKATRNVSILTQNIYRLPSLDSPVQKSLTTNLSPISSPSSPIPERVTRSNLTTAITGNDEDSGSDINSEESGPSESELSPIGPKISTSTALEANDKQNDNDIDYFSYHQQQQPKSEEDSSQHNKHQIDQDLLYDGHFSGLLKQSLDDCNVTENSDLWMSVLTKILKEINYIKVTDTLDIRQYVKIKKILGGKIDQTEVIDGLFMTNDVDSKKMASDIKNPRIALLMFPIEYLKQREQFISLRIIHAQQSVYITNLVSKLVSLEPDIVVVGDTVCGFAEKLLEDAGITTISNVKPQVIERISRYTNADIFQSVNDLFFKKGNLGVCDEFKVRRFKYGNKTKTFTFFTGTNKQMGFTISLRGGNEELLESIKYAAESLMPGYLNARFEKSLFNNMLLSSIKAAKGKELIDINEKTGKLQNDDQFNAIEPKLDYNEVIKYLDSFNTRKISSSPCVQFNLPVPLVNVIESYVKYFNYYKTNARIQELTTTEEINPIWKDQLKITYEATELPAKDTDLIKILRCSSESHLNFLLLDYQLRSRIWSNCLKYTSYQLYPIYHRNIHILHSTVSIKHATPCTGPNIVVVDYYTDNDKCLGLFLDQIFYDSHKTCIECGELLLDHYKSYVHGNAKIDLITEKYDIRFNSTHGDEHQGKNQRVMWSYCKDCNYITPIMAMSDDTYYMSIGKYFELIFYGQDTHGGCQHDFFKSYVKCFAFNDLVVRLEYSKIDNYEIIVPKKQLEFITDIDIDLKLESYKTIKTKAQTFFDSIMKRLNRVKLDTFVKAKDGNKRIKELKEKLANDSKQIFAKLQKIYEEVKVTNYLPLNVVYKDLQKLGIYWDTEFQEFEKKYLPSENEVNKITQFHLRKFLMDKYIDDKEVVENDDDICADEEEEVEEEKQRDNQYVKEPSHRFENPDNEDPSNEHDEGQKLLELPEFVPHKPREMLEGRQSDSSLEFKMFPANSLYEHNSKISDRIHKWEQNAQDVVGSGNTSASEIKSLSHRGSDSSLKSMNTVIPSQNKVIHLANFFDKMYYDQISLEFSKQREVELKKKSKIKAQPILDSKPIVEIYNKIEDVVGGSQVPQNDNSKSTSTAELKKSLDGEQHEKENLNIAKNKQLDIPEKQSLLKSLTNFWADRSATLWDPLAYPLESHEHTFADSDVVVREDEPSSLVAFCLSSNDYKQKIKTSFGKNIEVSSTTGSGNESECTYTSSSTKVKSDSNNNRLSSENHLNTPNLNQVIEETEPENSEDDYRTDDARNSKADSDKQQDNYKKEFSFGLNSSNQKKAQQFSKIEKKFKTKRNTNLKDNKQQNQYEFILDKKKSNHLKYQFFDGQTNLSCKIFYSEQFEALREICGVNENFIQSLSRCIKWQSSGGKSGSSFLKTLDNRYIVKELSKSELESFVSIAPFYFKYINQSMFYTLTTAIAKIFGFYQVEIKNSNGKNFKMDFLIMENLFYNHKTTRIFDLKGSMRNRHVQQTGKENEVLLDENMIEYIYESPVFVREQSKKLLRGCLFNDTSFLSAMDVMDYSLVIGIDDMSKKLYIGIIDWLRTFTWDKKVENWVKGNNLLGVGGNRKGKDPTIVTPKQYRIRFREAMERYILEVPDIWYEGTK